MFRKVLAYTLIVLTFGSTWWLLKAEESEELPVLRPVGMGVGLLLLDVMLGCPLEDILLMTKSPKWCPFAFLGYALLAYSAALVGKRWWFWWFK